MISEILMNTYYEIVDKISDLLVFIILLGIFAVVCFSVAAWDVYIKPWLNRK